MIAASIFSYGPAWTFVAFGLAVALLVSAARAERRNERGEF